MQISSRFTIAIHIFTCISLFKDEHKITSDFLATSINVNPVIIRRILQQLKNKGLICVFRGSGGAIIAKPLNEISLFDIFYAVNSIDNGKLFHYHENPNMHCPVGENIHNILDDRLSSVQQAMENQLKHITMQNIINDMAKYSSPK
ncbi:MAG: Rrf2 family transcriptional regulator [Brevinema sp.]